MSDNNETKFDLNMHTFRLLQQEPFFAYLLQTLFFGGPDNARLEAPWPVFRGVIFFPPNPPRLLGHTWSDVQFFGSFIFSFMWTAFWSTFIFKPRPPTVVVFTTWIVAVHQFPVAVDQVSTGLKVFQTGGIVVVGAFIVEANQFIDIFILKSKYLWLTAF